MAESPKDPKAELARTALDPTATSFAREAGEDVGRDLAKTAKMLADNAHAAVSFVNLLMAPFRGVRWLHEKLQKNFRQRAEEKLRAIPEEHQTAPKLLIASPIVEGLRHVADEPDLCEMFATLLATSMDGRKAASAHPAFVEIIRQLTPDEARLAKHLKGRASAPVVTVRARKKDGSGGIDVLPNFSHIGREAGVLNDGLMPAYIDNLCRLQICNIPPLSALVQESQYEPLEMDPELSDVRKQITEELQMDVEIVRRFLGITSFGRLFLDACVDESSAPP